MVRVFRKNACTLVIFYGTLEPSSMLHFVLLFSKWFGSAYHRTLSTFRAVTRIDKLKVHQQQNQPNASDNDKMNWVKKLV